MEQLAKPPYVQHVPTDGRQVLLAPYWQEDIGEWIFYVEVAPGQLGPLMGGAPVRADYLGRVAADPLTDFEVPLSTLIVRHLSFPPVMDALHALETDIHLFCDILAKYELISARAKEDHFAVHLAASEVEFLIRVLRSVYDILQRVVREVSSLLVTPNTNKKVMQELPRSFADVALKSAKPCELGELVTKFGMVPALAAFYVAEAPFFMLLREIRNAIDHYGRDIRLVFDLPNGLAVRVDDQPWRDLAIWNVPLAHNRLGPLRLVVAYLVSHVLGAIRRFAAVFEGPEFILPPPIGDFRVFLKNPYGRNVVRLPDMIKQPWDQPIDTFL